MFRQLRSILVMASRDFGHEAKLSICGILGIAAVLAPILVLFGLKFGIISTMTGQLQADPRARVLQPIGQGSYDAAWLDALRQHPDVGFLLATTRFLAATVTLVNPADPAIDPIRPQMVPTADGDPLLPAGMALPPRVTGQVEDIAVILSASAAERLKVQAGDRLDGRIGRTVANEPQSVKLGFVVAGVLPAAAFDFDTVLVDLDLLLAAEDYREGFAVPALGWTGRERADRPRSFASFRLYARTIEGVAPLRDWLAARQVQTQTEAARIDTVRRLDRNLTTLFLVIAGLGSLGYVLSMTVSLWASVVRKQRELSLLRLIGFSTLAIGLFPVVQAVWSGLLGAALASGLAVAIGPSIDRLFADQVRLGDAVFRLLPEHFAIAAGLTLCCALIAASLGGLRAAAIAPGEGLRDE